MSKASLELGGGNWGTKNGNLLAYAQGNESSNLVPREFTFTRGSDIAATRINSSGLIEKYRENLLLQSNQFDTTWSLVNVSATSGQGGYDGSSDAWLITKTTTTSGRVQQNKTSSGVQTFSAYAKKGTLDGVILRVDSTSGNQEVIYNLTNGSVVSVTGGVIDSSIESIGNDWYRIQFTFNTSITAVRIYPSTNTGGITTIGNIYIQDAQLEKGLVATSYLESGATTATSGVADNEPRIDYAGGTASLLLEPSRTNLMIHSEYFSGLSLSGNPPIITQNYAVSPEGVQNAARVQDTDATNFKIIQTQFSITAGSTYTISVYVKKATSPISTYGGFYFDFDGGTRKTSNLIFDEYNGTLVNATGNAITSVIHPVIDEGDYWRFSATATDTGSNNLLRPTLRAGASANGTSLSLVTKDYTAYGFQCEEGSYPTSYIPTYGTSVTRATDSLGKYDLADSTSQTVFFQFKNVGYAGGGGEIVIEKANPVAAIFRIYAQATSGGVVLVQFRTEFPIQTYTFNTGKQTSEVQKVAFSISGTTAKAYCNGQLKHTFTVTETEMQVLNWRVQNTKYNTDKLLLFPTALTDRELVDLTSPYSTYQELVTAEGLTWESPTCTTNSITELQSI